MARRDSLLAPYPFPSNGVYDTSGFFAKVVASYLRSVSEQHLALFSLSTGNLFSTKKWNGGVLVTGNFFNEDNYNVLSETNASINGLISYNLKVFENSLIASSFFNSVSNTDLFSEFKIGRVFYADEKKFLVQLSIDAGTLKFNEAYYKKDLDSVFFGVAGISYWFTTTYKKL